MASRALLPNTSMSKIEKDQAASKKKEEQQAMLQKANRMFWRGEDEAVVGRMLLGKLRHCTASDRADEAFGVGRVVLHDSAFDEICTDGLLHGPPNRTVYCRASDCVRGYKDKAQEHDVVHFTLVLDHRGYRATEMSLAPRKPAENRIGDVIVEHETGGIIDSQGERFSFRAPSLPRGARVSFDVADDLWSGKTLASNVQQLETGTSCSVEVGVVGRIVKLTDQFGFIRTDSHHKDIYFHADQNLDCMELWDSVKFDIETYGQKSRAVRVLSVNLTELRSKTDRVPKLERRRPTVESSTQHRFWEANTTTQTVKQPCPTHRPAKKSQDLKPQVETSAQMFETKLQKDAVHEDASTVASADDSPAPADVRGSLLRLRGVMLQSGLNVDELDMKLKTLESSAQPPVMNTGGFVTVGRKGKPQRH